MNDREAGNWPAEPEADEDEQEWWRRASRISTIGIFVLLLGAFLFFARTLVAPIVAAAIISVIFGPLEEYATRYRIPPSLYALVCVVVVILAINLGLVLLGSLLADWTARLQGVALDRVFADDANSVRVAGYVVANARLSWDGRIGGQSLSPWLAVNNLFDIDYIENLRVNAGFGRYYEPAAGRTVVGGIAWRF